MGRRLLKRQLDKFGISSDSAPQFEDVKKWQEFLDRVAKTYSELEKYSTYLEDTMRKILDQHQISMDRAKRIENVSLNLSQSKLLKDGDFHGFCKHLETQIKDVIEADKVVILTDTPSKSQTSDDSTTIRREIFADSKRIGYLNIFFNQSRYIEIEHSQFINLCVEMVSRCFETSEKNRSQEFMLRKSRSEMLGEIVGGIAHEINNPLTIVIGNAEVIDRKLEERNEGKMRKSVLRILENAKRIMYLIDILKRYSLGNTRESQKTDMRKLVTDTVAIFKGYRSAEGIDVLCHFQDSGDSMIECNPQDVQLSFLNLMANAVESYPNKTGASIKVTLHCDSHESICLEISDSGEGIPEQNLEKVFNPFFTTKQDGKHPGLGLNSVENIVKEHNGTVKIQSSSAGTTVSVVLPRGKKGD